MKGQTFVLIPAGDNTGAATLNLNSVGAKDLKKNTGTAYAALVAGDLQAGQTYLVVYDDAGTDQFVVLNPAIPNFLAGTAGESPATVSGTQTLTNKSLTSPLITNLTSGRIPLAGASGLLTDSATITYTDSAATRKIGILGSGSTTAAFDVQNTHATGSARVNVSADGDGNAFFFANAAGAGDAYVSLFAGAVTWYAGVDNSASDRYAIGIGAGPGDLDAIRFDATTGQPHFVPDMGNTSGGAATAALKMGTVNVPNIFWGTNAPTVSAPKGSLYLRTDGSSTNNRAYINTDGSTAWTAITTVG